MRSSCLTLALGALLLAACRSELLRTRIAANLESSRAFCPIPRVSDTACDTNGLTDIDVHSYYHIIVNGRYMTDGAAVFFRNEKDSYKTWRKQDFDHLQRSHNVRLAPAPQGFASEWRIRMRAPSQQKGSLSADIALTNRANGQYFEVDVNNAVITSPAALGDFVRLTCAPSSRPKLAFPTSSTVFLRSENNKYDANYKTYFQAHNAASVAPIVVLKRVKNAQRADFYQQKMPLTGGVPEISESSEDMRGYIDGVAAVTEGVAAMAVPGGALPGGALVVSFLMDQILGPDSVTDQMNKLAQLILEKVDTMITSRIVATQFRNFKSQIFTIRSNFINYAKTRAGNWGEDDEQTWKTMINDASHVKDISDAYQTQLDAMFPSIYQATPENVYRAQVFFDLFGPVALEGINALSEVVLLKGYADSKLISEDLCRFNAQRFGLSQREEHLIAHLKATQNMLLDNRLRNVKATMGSQMGLEFAYAPDVCFVVDPDFYMPKRGMAQFAMNTCDRPDVKRYTFLYKDEIIKDIKWHSYPIDSIVNYLTGFAERTVAECQRLVADSIYAREVLFTPALSNNHYIKGCLGL